MLKKYFIPTLISFFLSFSTFAEGTKQLRPTASTFGQLNPFDKGGNFASYTSPEARRLHIRIGDHVEENIYFGFKQNNNDCFVRIKDPNGNIVFGPIALPASGSGRIDSYDEAVAGPKKVDPVNGYDYLSFNPTMNGDYYIELNRGSATVASTTNRRYEFFDITVVDTVDNEVRNGRVWSRLWALTTTSFDRRFSAKMYARRADSTMFRINYNGIRPYGFGIVANSYGLDSSLNFQLDRKSQAYESYYPEHQLFLSFPDTNEFPFVKDPPRFEPVAGNELSGCITEGYCFNINSNKQGQVIIIIDVDGVSGFQSGGRDVVIAKVIDEGTSCVEWDGLDGLGDTLRSGTISLEFQYEGGLVHSPIFDAENHDDGYITELLNRNGTTDTLDNFWDDSDISGTQGLNGCKPSCRTWGGNFGNEKTMNTWTIGYRDTVSFNNFSYQECPIDAFPDRDTLAYNVNNQIINIFDNDFTLQGVIDTANAIITVNPSFGTATYNSTLGHIVYSPNANFSGLDQLEYKICNTPAPIVCDSTTVTIVVGCPDGLTANYGLDYVDDNESDAGVPNEDRILGKPDNLGVQLFDNNDEIIVYFSRTIEAGEKYRITWRKQRVADSARMQLAESFDNVSYTLHPNPPKTIKISYIESEVTANTSFRFLRIRKLNSLSSTGFEIDGISYNYFDCAIDSDGDGVADRNDLDADNDGILDQNENPSGLNPYGDEDRDGIFNFEDSDYSLCGTFSGGVCSIFDFDGDGIPNHLDLDSDNDGIQDIVEAGGVDNDNDGVVDGYIDTDGDGWANTFDPDDSGTPHTLLNSDGRGNANFLDLDSDDDGIPDIIEAGGVDTDNDGVADDLTDGDSDGWSNLFDSDNMGTAHTIEDQDRDGFPNYADGDSDNDGILDIIEAGGTDANGDGKVDNTADNDGDGYVDAFDSDGGGTVLPIPNSDSNGKPNYLDIDADDDGIIDNIEGQATTTNPKRPTGSDDDNDGIDNAFDTDSGNSPLVPENTDGVDLADYLDLDSDNDGISDYNEAYDTNGDDIADTAPTTLDVDNDGLLDGFDNRTQNSSNGKTTNVTNNNQSSSFFPDSDNPITTERDWREVGRDKDNDGVLDADDIDDDNDGILDVDEGLGNNNPAGDEDGDGIINAFDSSDDGNGGDGSTTNYIDTNGDGVPDVFDADGDGIPNHLDLDSDNDGIPDIIEAGGIDTDGNGIVDGTFTDTDGDGWSNTFDPDNTGIPLADEDKDGDGLPNRIDLDADNDGIADIIEAGGVDADNDGKSDQGDTDFDGLSDAIDLDNGGSTLSVGDFDGDGVANYLDLDSDGDGISDNVEGQTTADFEPPTGNDTNNNGWDNEYDKGDGGIAITLSNNDGTEEADYLDIDSDGDGFPDWLEGFDDDEDGDALNDLILRANTYESANANPLHYVTSDDDDMDGIPNFLEDADLDGVPNFLDPDNTLYQDTDKDGTVDLYSSNRGAPSSTPDGNGDGEYDFRDTDNGISLPIDLIGFTAQKFGTNVILRWKTATEINNDYFIIERSIDGKHFEQICIHKGSGNSTAEKQYSDVDKSPKNGINYYRLSQVDFDGKSETFHHQVQAVKFMSVQSESTILYPNPTNGNQLFLQLEKPKAGNYQVQLLTSRGAVITEEVFKIESEVLQFEREMIRGYNLAKGVYFIRLQKIASDADLEESMETFKFVVQ